jgi:hypothetical protein
MLENPSSPVARQDCKAEKGQPNFLKPANFRNECDPPAKTKPVPQRARHEQNEAVSPAQARFRNEPEMSTSRDVQSAAFSMSTKRSQSPKSDTETKRSWRAPASHSTTDAQGLCRHSGSMQINITGANPRRSAYDDSESVDLHSYRVATRSKEAAC